MDVIVRACGAGFGPQPAKSRARQQVGSRLWQMNPARAHQPEETRRSETALATALPRVWTWSLV